jgi:aspartyl-tRNA(Asn)/glutamyl-tRNA(Gln) amidotransferase subunit A
VTNELAQKTVAELSSLIKDGQVSPVEVTHSVLERVKKYDHQINSYIEISEEQALVQAKSAEKEIREGNYRGKLHGIPMALKDIFYFKGEKVTVGSKFDLVFDYDATVVTKLKEAGVIFTGKLNLHEFAYGGTTNNPHFGPCRNPWNLDKIPGGSSGGSGAAVAADLSIASLGTDTAGSVRVPASICGIVGLKPTYGLVSKYGCFPLSWSLDHIGPITKTVEDAAILLDYIAGYDENDPMSTIDPVSTTGSFHSYTHSLTGDIKGMVIGIEEDFFFDNVDAEIVQLVKNAIKKLESMGAKIEVVSIPSLKYSQYAEFMTFMGESALIHKNNILSRPEAYGDEVRASLQLAHVVSAHEYLEAQQIRRKLTNEFYKVFKTIDVMIAPTQAAVPPNIGDDLVDINGTKQPYLDASTRLVSPFNLVGYPAISIPCGFSGGIPVGLQIAGSPFKEGDVLKVAYAYEQTNPLNGKKPDLRSFD